MLRSQMPLLEIHGLTIDFDSLDGPARAVDDVSLSLDAGKTLCLVGESGCGKTVSALSIARLLPEPPARVVAGRIRLDGKEVLGLATAELRSLRGRVVSYVFQEPAACLNPVIRVGEQIREAIRLHRPEANAQEEMLRLMRMVGIAAPESRSRDYPHQMSGGMQQRVVIAMAIASHPRLLVADEPTTALDVTVQAQILDLLKDLRDRLDMSILLITHNLGIVSGLADRVAVMYAGQIVEEAPSASLMADPLHPYTQALIRSVPQLAGEGGEKPPNRRLKSIPGTVPPGTNLPAGCRFHPRCDFAQPACAGEVPALTRADDHRQVRCAFWKEIRSGLLPSGASPARP